MVELIVKYFTHLLVSVILFWGVFLFDRLCDFNVLLEITIGNVVTVLYMVGVFEGVMIKTFCYAFGEAPG